MASRIRSIEMKTKSKNVNKLAAKCQNLIFNNMKFIRKNRSQCPSYIKLFQSKSHCYRRFFVELLCDENGYWVVCDKYSEAVGFVLGVIKLRTPTQIETGGDDL